MVILETINLAIGYDRPLARNINIRLDKPTLIQVIGPNGAGKTTFLKTLAGLVKPLDGKVLIDNVDVTARPEVAGKYVAYLPQLGLGKSIDLLPVSVWEFVEIGVKMCLRRRGKNASIKELKNIVRNALRTVELEPETWSKSIWNLSGGQRQRALIARALGCEAPILLLDEPFSAIDPEGKIDIALLLGDLKKDRIVIVSCHDPELLLKQTDYMMLLGRGMYIFDIPAKIMNADLLRKVYGEAIVEFANHVHICDYHA
ncbi:MAG: metal ABC transporter ATP-binding protein [Ignisphaera sp.]|nr:metal ABC transporter ATP-binding protein [Ignisphaera sp.]